VSLRVSASSTETEQRQCPVTEGTTHPLEGVRETGATGSLLPVPVAETKKSTGRQAARATHTGMSIGFLHAPLGCSRAAPSSALSQRMLNEGAPMALSDFTHILRSKEKRAPLRAQARDCVPVFSV